MKFDFDKVIDRHNTASMKWDSGEPDILAMWVADMDFETVPAITKALIERSQHGVFGYSFRDDAFFEALIGWFRRRHKWTIDCSWVAHSPGIVAALHFLVKSMLEPGDKVMMHAPVYYPFFGSCLKNNTEVEFNKLLYVNGRYHLDFQDFERIAKDPKVKMFYMSSPHNPGGRIWTREELERMGRICTDNGVLVVSDEIHCDLVYHGKNHTPYGILPEDIVQNSIICVAPSKTFNLAGLQTSCLIIPNPELKKRYDTFLASLGIMRPNVYGITGLTAAYTRGDEWLDQLLEYLAGNLEFLRNYLKKNIPDLKLMEPDATYLVWLDFKNLHVDSRKFHDVLLKQGKVWLDEGYLFGEVGEGFERINIACPRPVLAEGLNRIKRALTEAGII